MTAYALEVKNIEKHFIKKVRKKGSLFSEKKDVKAVDNISFAVKKGEILGVIGESGCGKSTLGKLLVALEEPTAGEILLQNQNVKDLMRKDKLTFKRNIQVIFQNPFDTFDPRQKISSILLNILEIHSIGKTKEERRHLVINALNEVGLSPGEKFLSRYPHELSGGQLQRISIVRAMLLEPEILIADESVSMLDVSVRAEIINLLLKLVKEKNTTLIFISHDLNTTGYLCDTIAVMYLGRIVEYGDTLSIVRSPKHPYTKTLLSNTSDLSLDFSKKRISIVGEPPTPIDNGPGCYFAPRCYLASTTCFNSYPEEEHVSERHQVSCFNYKLDKGEK